jgi:hypothetical protein
VKSKIEKKNIESQTWGSGRWAFFKKFDHSNHAPIFQFPRMNTRGHMNRNLLCFSFLFFKEKLPLHPKPLILRM